VETPLIAMRKEEIVRLGVELGAPFHVSWSCYSGEAEACGVCESCVLRLRAFRKAGTVDPIPYAIVTEPHLASKFGSERVCCAMKIFARFDGPGEKKA
jgi:hypothetical protein